MFCSQRSAAWKRYNSRVIASSAVYAIVLIGAVWAFKHDVVGGPVRYLVAAAPALPLIGVIASMGLFLKEEEDEFQRRLMIEQMLWGTGATLSVATLWGFLETFGLAPHVEAYYVAVLWFAMFGVARAIVMWRYR